MVPLSLIIVGVEDIFLAVVVVVVFMVFVVQIFDAVSIRLMNTGRYKSRVGFVFEYNAVVGTVRARVDNAVTATI